MSAGTWVRPSWLNQSRRNRVAVGNVCLTAIQGSCCAAILGFGTESRWDSIHTSNTVRRRWCSFAPLNFHRLLVFRHDDLGGGFHGAQGLGMGKALRLFTVDAKDFADVAGELLHVML